MPSSGPKEDPMSRSRSQEAAPPVEPFTPTAAEPAHVPGWDMQDKDDPSKNTHLWIVVEALQMVGTLTGPQGAAAKLLLQLTTDQQAQLHQGIWDADNLSPWDDHIYAYHFYDPDTDSNYYSCFFTPDLCRQTARMWGAKCFTSSLYAYMTRDLSTAVYQLGLSLHYLTDVGQPMHAANFTAYNPAAPTYHQGFESYVIDWTNENKPAPLPYVQTVTGDAYEPYIESAARLAKVRAKEVLLTKDALDAWNKRVHDPTDHTWERIADPAIDGALQDIRRITAQYLLMWIQQAVALIPPHTWSLEDLTHSANGPIAKSDTLGAEGLEQERVFSLDGDRHVQALTRGSDGNWQAQDLTAQTGAPVPNESSPVAATAAPGSNAAEPGALVAFLGSDRHVHACLAAPGQDWKHLDLTVEAGAQPARGNLLCAYGTAYVPSEQIVFVDDAGHVQSITRVDGGSWTTLDLTKVTGAPPMDGPALSGSAWDHASLQAVVYLDAAGHVHELGGWQQGSDPWTTPWHADLTAITGAPVAAGALIAGSAWNAGDTKQAAFVGADGHIYELSIPYTDSLPWTCTDLTAATDAPVVGMTALVAFEWPADSEKHTLYLDVDGHVHDLHLGPTGTWKYLDVTQELNAPTATGRALTGYGLLTPARLLAAFVDGHGHEQAAVAQPGG
jgi:phospholipase C